MVTSCNLFSGTLLYEYRSLKFPLKTGSKSSRLGKQRVAPEGADSIRKVCQMTKVQKLQVRSLGSPSFLFDLLPHGLVELSRLPTLFDPLVEVTLRGLSFAQPLAHIAGACCLGRCSECLTLVSCSLFCPFFTAPWFEQSGETVLEKRSQMSETCMAGLTARLSFLGIEELFQGDPFVCTQRS